VITAGLLVHVEESVLNTKYVYYSTQVPCLL